MSRRDMKVGPIETNMVGIDRKALGQIFEDFPWFIKLKNSTQITQQSLSNIQDVAVPENDHQNTERCMPVSTLWSKFMILARRLMWVIEYSKPDIYIKTSVSVTAFHCLCVYQMQNRHTIHTGQQLCHNRHVPTPWHSASLMSKYSVSEHVREHSQITSSGNPGSGTPHPLRHPIIIWPTPAQRNCGERGRKHINFCTLWWLCKRHRRKFSRFPTIGGRFCVPEWVLQALI